ncbi:hypothetical protein L226DRAFT_234361 [Lentinus tigrinus ALCF2SS1-7]|uniref:uncharacterized protein n=1 Tax=Lentinus tigrinus ALCF2SS1-7 TaxID=1328758 RepID=UPI001165F37A|nr:hypothetical protein L226DRAFT_234361 [Lentinus tigrinus ALCF2SS1-7]
MTFDVSSAIIRFIMGTHIPVGSYSIFMLAGHARDICNQGVRPNLRSTASLARAIELLYQDTVIRNRTPRTPPFLWLGLSPALKSASSAREF